MDTKLIDDIDSTFEKIEWGKDFSILFMPPKELWEAYSNRTVRPSVRPSLHPAFVSGPYLLYSLR